MTRLFLSLLAVPFLTMSAVAGPLTAADKPMVVAQGIDVGVGGASVEVGNRDRDRDRHRGEWRRHDRDRDREGIVIKRKHRDHDREGRRDHD